MRLLVLLFLTIVAFDGPDGTRPSCMYCTNGWIFNPPSNWVPCVFCNKKGEGGL